MLPSLMGDDSKIVQAFPELRQITDPVDRAHLYWRAYRDVRWRTLCLYLSLVIPVLGMFLWNMSSFTSWLCSTVGGSSTVCVFVGAFAVLPFALVNLHLARSFFWRRFQKAIRRELLEQGHVVCMRCGYDLQGQTQARCPECGMAFDPVLLQHKHATPATTDSTLQDVAEHLPGSETDEAKMSE